MPRYFFDLHGLDASRWDEEGLECTDRDEIERQARQILEDAAATVSESATTATLYAIENGLLIVLTAKRDPSGNISFTWHKR